MKLAWPFLLLMPILLSSGSRAEGLRIVADPYLGYGLLGSFNASLNGTNTKIGSMHGFGYGVHAQVEFYHPIFLGLDLSYFPSLNFSASSNVTGSMPGVNPLVRLGPTLGARWNKYLFYVGYNFVNQLSQRLTVNSTSLSGTWKGSSSKLGVGYRPSDNLGFHAEYFFENYKSNGASNNMLLLSVHLPITVFDNMRTSSVAEASSSSPSFGGEGKERAPAEVKPADVQKSVVYFKLGEVSLDSSAVQILEKMSRKLSDPAHVKIRVEGHADSSGLKTSNEKKSLLRAQSVREFFLRKGVESKNISVRGFSFFHPVQDNSTPHGRAKNRRAEIFLELESNREASGVKQ